MEALPREELERLVFFESAREQAELDWKQNPRDAQVLLSEQPRSPPDSVPSLPVEHKALFCLLLHTAERQ